MDDVVERMRLLVAQDEADMEHSRSPRPPPLVVTVAVSSLHVSRPPAQPPAPERPPGLLQRQAQPLRLPLDRGGGHLGGSRSVQGLSALGARLSPSGGDVPAMVASLENRRGKCNRGFGAAIRLCVLEATQTFVVTSRHCTALTSSDPHLPATGRGGPFLPSRIGSLEAGRHRRSLRAPTNCGTLMDAAVTE